MIYDVVIVGGGPVGLMLARWLGLAQKSVLVIEKRAHLSEHSKAATIWGGTQEVLDKVGLMPFFLSRSIVHQNVTLWNADVPEPTPFLHLPLQELAGETPFAQLLVIPQNRTEEILHQSLKDLSKVEVIFQASLKSLCNGQKSVKVEYTHQEQIKSVEARFVVGCDGAHSEVRQELGLTLKGSTYSFRAALADVRLQSPVLLGSPRLTLKDGLSVAIQIEENTWRLIIPIMKEKDFSLEESITQKVRLLLGEVDYECLWSSEFSLHDRISSQFVVDRVVLAGDAAHLNSPVGGQGMNSGLQDTQYLAQALIQALETNVTDPLNIYSKKRRLQIKEGVNKYTDRMTNLIFIQGGRYIRYILKLMMVVMKIKPIRLAFMRRVLMLKTRS